MGLYAIKTNCQKTNCLIYWFSELLIAEYNFLVTCICTPVTIKLRLLLYNKHVIITTVAKILVTILKFTRIRYGRSNDTRNDYGYGRRRW